MMQVEHHELEFHIVLVLLLPGGHRDPLEPDRYSSLQPRRYLLPLLLSYQVWDRRGEQIFLYGPFWFLAAW